MSAHQREQMQRAMIGEQELEAIGSAMVDERGFDEVAALLSPRHFVDHRCRVVFEAMHQLRTEGKPTDAELIAPLVEKRDVTPDELVLMMDAVPHSEHARYYAKRVLESWKAREVSGSLLRTMSALKSATVNVDEVIAQHVREVESVLDGESGNSKEDFGHIESWLLKVMDQPEVEHWTTGLPELDGLTKGGFSPGQLIVIGARPGVGKTSLLSGMAIAGARAGHTCKFLSFEMPGYDVTKRILSQAHLSVSDPIDMERGSAQPFYLKEAYDWTIDKVEAEARRYVRLFGLRVLFVDYLSLIKPRNPNAQRYEQVADISRSLKRLAGSAKIAVVAAQQLNRDVEKRQSKKPLMSDFRESGSVEQDADILIGLERPTKPDEGDRTKAVLHVMKHRNGDTSSIDLDYGLGTYLFRSRLEGAF